MGGWKGVNPFDLLAPHLYQGQYMTNTLPMFYTKYYTDQMFPISDSQLEIDYELLNSIFKEPKKNFIEKSSNKIGCLAGKTKNFFSKKETKAGVLLGYWAADAFVALILILTGASLTAAAIATALLIIHTYATFSVIGEIL